MKQLNIDTQFVAIERLKVPTWNTNFLLAGDRRQLRSMIEEHGLFAPIIVRRENDEIIDGSRRVEECFKLKAKVVPVTYVDCDTAESIILHVRLNRHRSEQIPKRVSHALQQIVRSGAYEQEDLMNKLAMSVDEFTTLIDGTLIKTRRLRGANYSNAWVPIETTGEPEAPSIERPPNKDT